MLLWHSFVTSFTCAIKLVISVSVPAKVKPTIVVLNLAGTEIDISEISKVT